MHKPKAREIGYIQQLAVYIRKNLSKGYTQEALKWALINQGYSRLEVEKAEKLANEQLAAQAPKMIEKPVIRIETIPPAIEEQAGFWQKIKDIFG